VNTRLRRIEKLKDKAYRTAFVKAQIQTGIAYQIGALREKRGWTQGELGRRAGMAQGRISRLEDPSYGKVNVETLRRLAEAFDVGLVLRFSSFGEMVDWSENLSTEALAPPSFEQDPGCQTSSTAAATVDLWRVFGRGAVAAGEGSRCTTMAGHVETRNSTNWTELWGAARPSREEQVAETHGFWGHASKGNAISERSM